MTAYESRLSALPLSRLGYRLKYTFRGGFDSSVGEINNHAGSMHFSWAGIMMISSSWAPDSQIEYFKGSRCGFENCKSKRYYIEEGFTYCQDGHQQDTVRTLSNSKHFLSWKFAIIGFWVDTGYPPIYQGPQTHADDEDFHVQQGVKKRQKKDDEEKTYQRRMNDLFPTFPLQIFPIIFILSSPSRRERERKRKKKRPQYTY